MRIIILLGAAFLGLGAAMGLAAAEAVPLESFGALPQVSSVELSPNGNLLAWHDESTGAARIVIFDLGTQRLKGTMPVTGGVKLRGLTWVSDDTLLAHLSVFTDAGDKRAAYHYEMQRTLALDLVTGKQQMLLMSDGARALVTSADLLAWRTPKPHTVIMSTFDYSRVLARSEMGTRLAGHRKDSGWVAQVFEVDTRTGKGTLLETGSQFTDQWVVDARGNVIARGEWEPTGQVTTILARQDQGWRQLLREEHSGRRALYGVTGDGAAILMSGTNGQGRQTLVTLPLDGSPSKTLIEDATYDISGVSFDHITNAPVSATLGGLENAVRWLDHAAEKQYLSVAGAFPGKRVAVYGRSEDSKRVLAAVESPSTPTVYYIVDFSTNKADIVGEAYPHLAGVKLGEVRAITYKARDGAAVPAYLTLPPESSGKGVPLVVLPHGGPESRDDFGFDWLAQFLAVRGYAVLQPQFRGSTGFGEAWRLAGYQQWGGLMQQDVTDGVKALIEQGVADAGRVCIVGGSYGGYAALAGAAFTPELYRCIVSINGVSDLPEMLGYEKAHSGAESDSVAYWSEHIGSPFDQRVIDASPRRASTRVKAPVLLIHSSEDTVVPVQQSELMARALSASGKTVTLVKVAGEDHWLSQSPTRVQVLKALDEFLATNLRTEH